MPLSVSQLFKLNKGQPIDIGKYHLISGVVLAHDDKLIGDGVSLSEYLKNMDQKNTIAKVIYKNELRSGNFSSTAGLQHLENRFNKDNFWLIDNHYASKVSQVDGSEVSQAFKQDIQDKLLYVKLNPNIGTWQLPQRKKICEEFSFAEKRASAHEIIRMQIQEGACLSMLGTITITSSGEL